MSVKRWVVQRKSDGWYEKAKAGTWSKDIADAFIWWKRFDAGSDIAVPVLVTISRVKKGGIRLAQSTR